MACCHTWQWTGTVHRCVADTKRTAAFMSAHGVVT